MFRGRYLRSYLLWYEAANVGKSQFVPSKLSVVLFPNSQKKAFAILQDPTLI